MKKVLFVLLAAFVLMAMASPALAKPRSTVNKSGETLTQEQIDRANAEAEAEYARIPKAPRNTTPPGTITPQEIYPGEYRYLGVPDHRQQRTYWCGPASLENTIHFLVGLGGIPGLNDFEKQQHLAIDSGTTTYGSNTYNLRQTLNSHIGGAFTYQVMQVDSYSGDYWWFWDVCYNRIITLGKPICVLVNTAYLPYYGGTQCYHYIVVDGMQVYYNDYTGQVETTASTVRVVDPHYSDSFFGNHTLLWTDLLNAVVGYFIPPDGCQTYNVIW